MWPLSHPHWVWQSLGTEVTALTLISHSLHLFFPPSDVHICEHQSPCQNGAQCIYDRDGDYSCLCPEGFHGKDCEMKAGPCEKAG